MKNRLNTKLKVIRNEKYFILSSKIQNAKTEEELLEIEKEIDKEIENQEYQTMVTKFNNIKNEYETNIEKFSTCEQLSIEKMLKKSLNNYNLNLILPVLEIKVTQKLEFLKLKEELNNREIIKEKIEEFNNVFNEALPYMSHDKYIEIKNEMKKQSYNIYNYKILEVFIEELKIIIEIEKEYLRNSPGEETIMFIRKRINKKNIVK